MQFTPADRNNPNWQLRYDTGEIIDVVQDGWVFSDRELTNPQWRIIWMPGVPVDGVVVQTLMATINNPTTGGISRRRSSRIGWDLVPKSVQNLISKNQVTTLTQAQIDVLTQWVQANQ